MLVFDACSRAPRCAKLLSTGIKLPLLECPSTISIDVSESAARGKNKLGGKACAKVLLHNRCD
jgi:hypothetical protein